VAKALRHPKELEDDPCRRYQELMADRHFGLGLGVKLAALFRAAALASLNLAPAQEAPTTPATAGASNWVQLGPLAIPNGQSLGGVARIIVSGRLTEIVPHPTDPLTIYVAAARGGVWKTTDGGVTWNAMSDNAVSLAIGALALAPSNPQVLYAGTGEGNIYYYAKTSPLHSVNESYNGSGVLKTTDGGNNWSVQGAALFLGACFYRLAVHPTDPNTVFAASNLGLHRSTDGGTNWLPMTNGLPAISNTVVACTDVVFDPSQPDTVYTAFWGTGTYKTTNATAANPAWTKLAGGLPATNLSRIALAVSPTAPQNVYALLANASDSLNGFYTSPNGGTNWTPIAAPGVRVYGAYTLNVAVDVATPDIVYLSGLSLYKAVRTAGTWSVTDIGEAIHADNHAFGRHPTDHLTVYAGNDGGIYKSTDGGTTWDDTINEGLCISQIEFIDQHPTSDAFVIGGTQDNGTEIYRGSPAFHHSADGDGGMAGVDATTPRNVIHTYYNPSPERSVEGGTFGTYTPIRRGLLGTSLFYPPFDYDETNSQNIAFGTDRINLDAAQGTGGWPVKVVLPGISGVVSAICYVHSDLIYTGTTSGQVYRLTRSGTTWAAQALQAAPLPSRWIWDIAPRPGDVNTVVLVMSGFGTPHVWRGAVAASGTSASWTDISGTAPNRIPDIPVNALCIEPGAANVMYVGTDVGVFRTTDEGATWQLFSDGLPNTAIYDLKLHTPARLLRAATHGRGLWERKLDTISMPDVDLFVRHHLMDTARITPTPSPVSATFADPLQHVAVGDALWWFMCADVKIDAPAPTTHTYQLPVAAVDYLAFETKLAHRDPQRGVINRVYVQIHNRGIQAATDVVVKILYADAGPGLPNLPADFWTAFPGDGTTTFWKPIGAAQTIASLSPTRPAILEWDWVPPASAAPHSCLLVVIDSTSNPIPPGNKVFAIGTLVTTEKRVGLKNLHVIDAQAPTGSPIHFAGTLAKKDVVRLSAGPSGWTIGLLLPAAVQATVKSEGLKAGKLTREQLDALKEALGERFALYKPQQYQVLAANAEATLTNFPEKPQEWDLLLFFTARASAEQGAVVLLQESGGTVVGGNTFILSPPQD
jgi:photosystem II stability/assembly factor-like uncharacterized protein